MAGCREQVHKTLGSMKGGEFIIRLEDLKAVALKSTMFWDITQCSLIEVYRHFGGIY
jgi:hypothetical protein